MPKMNRSNSLLRFEDEQNLEPKQETAMNPKMQTNSLSPLGHDRLQENTMDQMQPHTQQPLLQNQQGVQVTPELITKILKEI